MFTVLFAALATLAAAGPVQKRYTNSLIVSYRTGTCLTTPPGVQIQDGTLLTVGDCSTATRWDINPGSGSVIVTGTNFALDAGVGPHNNVPAKVWTSYPGLTQQTWYLTPDNRIAITGGNQCLDEGDNGPQTYQCTTGNTNQVWYVQGGVTPSSSSSAPASSSASASASASASMSSSAAPPTATGQKLVWATNNNMCATLQGAPGNGTIVNVNPCTGASTQLWNAMGNGQIQLAGTTFCLDAGINPSNGVQMKVWQCFPGLAQQTYSFPGSGTGLFITANNQCLDVNNANNVQLQTWTCSSPDPQQQFYLQ